MKLSKNKFYSHLKCPEMTKPQRKHSTDNSWNTLPDTKHCKQKHSFTGSFKLGKKISEKNLAVVALGWDVNVRSTWKERKWTICRCFHSLAPWKEFIKVVFIFVRIHQIEYSVCMFACTHIIQI